MSAARVARSCGLRLRLWLECILFTKITCPRDTNRATRRSRLFVWRPLQRLPLPLAVEGLRRVADNVPDILAVGPPLSHDRQRRLVANRRFLRPTTAPPRPATRRSPARPATLPVDGQGTPARPA